MSITAEIKGKTADRFRAYASVKLTRKATAEDHHNRGAAGLPPLEKGAGIRYDGEEVVASGPVTGGSLKFTAPDKATITKVVFFSGPEDAETVVGSADVNASGKIAIDFVEPVDQAAPAKERQIVDEV